MPLGIQRGNIVAPVKVWKRQAFAGQVFIKEPGAPAENAGGLSGDEQSNFVWVDDLEASVQQAQVGGLPFQGKFQIVGRAGAGVVRGNVALDGLAVFADGFARARTENAFKRGVPLKNTYTPQKTFTNAESAEKIVTGDRATRGEPEPPSSRALSDHFFCFNSSSTALAAVGMLVPGPKMAATPAL